MAAHSGSPVLRAGSCDSAITFIDGKKGVLLYRGCDIEQLADQGDFLDSAYLLLHGDLPSAAQKAAFDEEITLHTLVHEQLIQFFKGFKHDAHPMAIMVRLNCWNAASSTTSSGKQLPSCVCAQYPTGLGNEL